MIFLPPARGQDLKPGSDWHYGGFLDLSYAVDFNFPENHICALLQLLKGPIVLLPFTLCVNCQILHRMQINSQHTKSVAEVFWRTIRFTAE